MLFQTPITTSTGHVRPGGIALADFNGDGKPDLAICDTPVTSVGAIGNISIYLNQNGSLPSTPMVTTLQNGDLCGTILAGDVNGDGKTDLVMASQYTNRYIVVLLGNGDGTFKLLPAVPGSVVFLSGKIADFNGDGKPDLFLGGNGEPYLYLGNGDGTFAPQTIPTVLTYGNYQSVVTGDFNGDKKLDAIAVNYNDPPFNAGSLIYFVGDGQGGLANPVFYQPAAITNPLIADVADFNHDGKLDLVIGSDSAYIALGNGDGTFQTDASQLIPLAVPPFSEIDVLNPDTYNVVVADLDHDGAPDVAALDSKTGRFSLFLNDGTGTFPNAKATPYTFQFPANTFAIAIADINGDGLPDIVLSNYDNNTITQILSKTTLAAASVTLTGSVNNALVGTPLTFTVDVASTSGTPSGTVTLMDGPTQVGQQTLSASGNATFTASNLTAGMHPLTASYSGDARFTSSTSSALNEAVTDFQIAVTPPTQTITAGSSASYMLSVTPVGGFTGNVSLSCAGLPTLATCNAQTITVTSGVASQTVVISTAASTTAMSTGKHAAVYAGALFGGICFCFGWRRKARRAFPMLTILSLAMILPLALGTLGCGGSSSPKLTPGTPSGSSTITIMATVTESGVTATHTATGTLVVQ